MLENSNLCTAQGVSMVVLTCVYPQVNLEVMGGAEGLATVWAVLGGRAQAALTMLGQRWLNAPRRLPHVLPNIWSRHKEGETNGRCVECHFKPAPHTSQHNTFCFIFFPSPLLPVCHCPSFSLAHMCERHTKSNASNRFTGCAVSIPSRTLTVHKLFFRKTIVLRYTATHPPPTPTP